MRKQLTRNDSLLVFATTAMLAAAIASPCCAQGFVSTDVIGVFLDEEGCYTCGNWGAHPFTVQSAYLILWNPTSEGDIMGWEGSLPTIPSTFPAGFTLEIAGGGVNAATWPELRVSLAAALPRASTVKLATFSTFYLGGPVVFGIGPAHPSSLPDSPAPAYFALPDAPTPRPLEIWSKEFMPGVQGAFEVADATSSTGNCEGPPRPGWWCEATPTEPVTWGAVKGLYR